MTDLGRPLRGNHATHEPSLASRLGPSGECQAQEDPATVWTTGERWACNERCAEVGDPPCWDLGEPYAPCVDCAGASIPEDAEQRRSVNELGWMLAALRANEEAAVAVTYTAYAGTTDCPTGYVSVRIDMEKESATSEAVNLIDALWLARAKVRALVAKRKAEEAEAKASVGRNAKRQDAEERLGPKDEHAVPPEEAGDAQRPSE